MLASGWRALLTIGQKLHIGEAGLVGPWRPVEGLVGRVGFNVVEIQGVAMVRAARGGRWRGGGTWVATVLGPAAVSYGHRAAGAVGGVRGGRRGGRAPDRPGAGIQDLGHPAPAAGIWGRALQVPAAAGSQLQGPRPPGGREPAPRTSATRRPGLSRSQDSRIRAPVDIIMVRRTTANANTPATAGPGSPSPGLWGRLVVSRWR